MQPARILVIEDSEMDVELLRSAFDELGEDYQLDVLRDGDEALRFVQGHRSGLLEPEPCIILLDLYLPIYDGIAILRAIRAAPALEHIHVMVLSGLASPSQEAEIATLGAVYRPKPFALDQLCGLAAEILEICRSWPIPIPVTR